MNSQKLRTLNLLMLFFLIAGCGEIKTNNDAIPLIQDESETKDKSVVNRSCDFLNHDWYREDILWYSNEIFIGQNSKTENAEHKNTKWVCKDSLIHRYWIFGDSLTLVSEQWRLLKMDGGHLLILHDLNHSRYMPLINLVDQEIASSEEFESPQFQVNGYQLGQKIDNLDGWEEIRGNVFSSEINGLETEIELINGRVSHLKYRFIDDSLKDQWITEITSGVNAHHMRFNAGGVESYSWREKLGAYDITLIKNSNWGDYWELKLVDNYLNDFEYGKKQLKKS